MPLMSSDLIAFECSKCGAQLSIDGSTQTPTCAYCQAQTLLPESVWRRVHPPAAAPSVPLDVKRGNVASRLGVGGAVVVALVFGAIVSATQSKLKASAAPLNPIAAVGEACDGRRAACAKDGKSELSCGAGGKMAVVGTCKGPNACRVTDRGDSITCDTTLADPGDPCNVTDSACATDHKAEVRCQGGRFAVLATCKGPDGCTLTPSSKGKRFTLSCDDHIADVGDPCFDSTRTACSSDGKSLLTCTAQRFVVDRACKRGCKLRKIVGTDETELDCD
jgi:DNA-directed RNA polymerase subunit RPC12/RpoP